MSRFPLRYPAAVRHFDSPHYWRDKDAGPREFVVEHIMAGRIGYLDKMAQSPKGLEGGRKVSVHFGITETGEVHQYLDLNLACWGAGRVDDPLGVERDFGVKIRRLASGKYNGNLGSIQIEHEGTPQPLSYAPALKPWGKDNPLPEAMIEASLTLQEWLVREGVVKPKFLRHGDLTPSMRPNDPGAEVDAHITFPLRKRDWSAPTPPQSADTGGYAELEARYRQLEDRVDKLDSWAKRYGG